MLFVILGILCSAIVNWFPRPVTGRVELRKSIARTFRDLSVMYGAIFANILDSNSKGPLSQVKEFKRLGLGVQRQLMEENTYLKLSKLEPPLKGKFPFNSYKELLIRLNNMADLIEGMAYSASALDKSWRLSLIQVLNEERFDYVCSLILLTELNIRILIRIVYLDCLFVNSDEISFIKPKYQNAFTTLYDLPTRFER